MSHLAHLLLKAYGGFWVWSAVTCFIGFSAGVLFGLRAARAGRVEVIPDPIPRARIVLVRPDPDPDDIRTAVDAAADLHTRRLS